MKQFYPVDGTPPSGMTLQALKKVFTFTILGEAMILKNPLIESMVVKCIAAQMTLLYRYHKKHTAEARGRPVEFPAVAGHHDRLCDLE